MGTRTLLGLLMNGYPQWVEDYLSYPFVLGEELLAFCICHCRERKQPQQRKVSLVSRIRKENHIVEYLVTLINGVRAAPISVRNSSLYKAFNFRCQKE